MPAFGKIHRRRDILEGIVTAGLITGAFLTWTFTDVIWAVPLAGFIIGAVNAMDNVFPYGRQTFVYSWLSGLALGTAAVILSSFFGLMLWFMLLCVLVFTFKVARKAFLRLAG